MCMRVTSSVCMTTDETTSLDMAMIVSTCEATWTSPSLLLRPWRWTSQVPMVWRRLLCSTISIVMMLGRWVSSGQVLTTSLQMYFFQSTQMELGVITMLFPTPPTRRWYFLQVVLLRPLPLVSTPTSPWNRNSTSSPRAWISVLRYLGTITSSR